MKVILVALSTQAARECVRQVFQEGYELDWRDSLSDILHGYNRHRYDLALIDVSRLSEGAEATGARTVEPFGRAFQEIRARAPAAEVIAVCGGDRADLGVQAVQAGARSYLTYPLRAEALRFAVDAVFESVRRESEIHFLRDEMVRADTPDLERTEAPAMREALRKAHMVAPTRSNVLITGETGTGKGVLARFIHLHSNRRNAPFISVHCGAIPETLIESELFGHEKGAFTGANRRTPGKFEVAHGGTIFLDEVATIQPSVQIKLLQVLQERTVQRLGSERPLPVDVRIIAATNADLQAEVARGHFRSDLYYRLSVFPIEIPPLTERVEDIPRLVEEFLRRLRGYYAKDVRAADPRVIRALQLYRWPGNIRELENLVERAYILETSTILGPESFPAELFAPEPAQVTNAMDCSLTLAEVRQRCVDQVERDYIEEILRNCGGRIGQTAERAGIGPRQLHKLMAKHDIDKNDFRQPRKAGKRGAAG